jgi:hypothetical protein
VLCVYIVLPDTWAERERLQRNKERKRRLEEAKHELEVAQRKGDYEAASRLRYATIPEFEREIPVEGNGNGAMLSERVTSDDIARVVARATGIPVQSLLKGERERLVHVRAPFSPWPFTKERSYLGLATSDCVSTDGRLIEDPHYWTRPRGTRCQRRSAHFKGRAAGTYAACGLISIPGPDGRRQSA